MGRKKKKPSERRTNTLQIKLTVAERDEMNRAAEADEMDVSTWVRRKILELIRSKK